MRVVSFTDHLELDFEGNVVKNAIVLGDVDNDGLSELVVGNDKGELAVFKGESSKPLCSAKCMGIITAIAIGDALNIGKNVLFAVTACGLCSLYDLNRESLEEVGKKPLNPIHTQRIPANIKVAYIGDINGDGFSEVIVGLTDRVVRTFRWVSACQTVKDKIIGKLVGLNKWEFAEQIGTIALHKSKDGKPCIIVAQPSGTFITLHSNSFEEESSVEPLDESMGEFLTKISMNLEPLASTRFRNSEICGNIINKYEDDSVGRSLAIATLDGILMLVRNGKILWKLSLDHELFAVSCVDWTRDGNEEIAACAWDGNTFIVKHNNEGIQFSFHEPVNAFAAGMFGIKNQQTPCLVYVTFNGKIYLYYDVSVPYIIPKSLVQILKENKEYIKYAQSIGIDTDDANELRKLNKSLLYNF